MATGKLSLYNEALGILGQRRLSSLTEATEARRSLDDVWDGVTAYCLENGAWNFAMRAAEFASSTSVVPTIGYSYAFTKPDDWVRTNLISVNGNFDPPLLYYNDEGGYWYANFDPIYVKYVSDHVGYGMDLSLWPESFVIYVANRMAVRVCKRLLGSDPTPEMKKDEKAACENARSKDAMNEPEMFPPRGTWVRSRSSWGSLSSRKDGYVF